jgi:hypothetical protein
MGIGGLRDMEMKKSDVLILAGVGLVVGLILLNDSQCTGGCRTFAKYVTGHSASTLAATVLGGLFA